MYKHMLRILPLAAIIALAACKGQTKTKDAAANADSLFVDSLSQAVMNVHDEGMGKMMTIRRLKTRITEVSDSLQKKKAATDVYKAAAQLLDSANNAMNTWMHGYDMKMESKNTQEKKAYLESEMQKISAVKDLMQKSIQEAKTLLKEQ